MPPDQKRKILNAVEQLETVRLFDETYVVFGSRVVKASSIQGFDLSDKGRATAHILGDCIPLDLEWERAQRDQG